MYELLIANKETGEIWDVASITTSEVSVSTERSGSPAQLSFSLYLTPGVRFSHGDIVRFSVNGRLIFYGFIFTIEHGRWNACTVTCYDRLRYLKTNATYAFYALTVGDIIRQIAGDLQLDVGEIADTGYKIPKLIETDKDCIDIIQDALNQTLLNTGLVYVFYDNGVGLSLKQAGEWTCDTVLGDKSLVTEFSYKTDIDTNTYNSVKVVSPNTSTGKNDVIVVQDSANIERWGLLQLYQPVDEGLNTAQLAAQARQTLEYYNKIHKTLALETLGVDGLRAGMMVRILLPKAGFDSIAAWTLCESVSHSYSHDMHTMQVEVLELTDDLIGRATEDSE